jgi:hypothetical protein
MSPSALPCRIATPPLGRLLVVGVVLITRGPVKRELGPSGPATHRLFFSCSLATPDAGAAVARRRHPEARRTMPQIARWLVEPDPHRNSRPSLPVTQCCKHGDAQLFALGGPFRSRLCRVHIRGDLRRREFARSRLMRLYATTEGSSTRLVRCVHEARRRSTSPRTATICPPRRCVGRSPDLAFSKLTPVSAFATKIVRRT